MAADNDNFEVPSETEVEVIPHGDTMPTCCKHGCTAALEESVNVKTRVAEIQMALSANTFDKNNELRYEILKTMLSHHSDLSEVKPQHRAFLSWDMPLCIRAVSQILNCSLPTIRKLVDHLVGGHVNPPGDGRSLALKSESDERHAAGMIWNWVS